VIFTPDGNLAIASGYSANGQPALAMWNLQSGAVVCQLKDPQANFRSLALSPDGYLLMTGSQADGAVNDLILWDVQRCQEIRRFDVNPVEDVTGIAFSSDGKWAITGTAYNKRIILWDVNTGHEIKRFEYENARGMMPILDVAFGPDDRTILAPLATELHLWDIKTNAIIRRFIGHSGNVWCVNVSPDGKYVLSAGDNGEVILWDFSTGQELARLQISSLPVISAKFSPDGKYAYAISADGTLIRWKIPIQTLPELLEWINTNRYLRQLTCDERLHYRVEPLCVEGNP
jgi:WD40 repeat protein